MAWLKIGAVVALLAALGCGYAYVRHQNEAIHKLKVDNKALTSSLKAAQTAVRLETKIQTVTRIVTVKAEKAAAHVQTIDPKCAAGDLLVADFRAQLDGLRKPAPASDTPAP